jgi:hypothetical protein
MRDLPRSSCGGDETKEEISGVNEILWLSWAHKKELGGLLQQEPDDYYTGEARFGLGVEEMTGEYCRWHKETCMPFCDRRAL